MTSANLIQACKEGDLETVKSLCEAGADIRYCNNLAFDGLLKMVIFKL